MKKISLLLLLMTGLSTGAAHSQVFTAISAGGAHTCVIHNGAVKCWGANYDGQLGDGTRNASRVPVQVKGLTSGVTAVSAHDSYTCVIQNGAAKCWGSHSYDLYGDGTNDDSPVPVQVSSLTSGVTSISVGERHTCAIQNGAAKCWGSNRSAQLGDGTRNASRVPVQVSGLISGVTAIAAGTHHTCAIHNGAAKCWGGNILGVLGDGTWNNSSTPVQVSGLTSGVTAISTSGNPTCAIHNGAAKCWGSNSLGLLGDGTNDYRFVPVQVIGLTSGVTMVSISRIHACAIHNGAAKCWGSNSLGLLGDGTNSINSFVPVQVSGLTSGVTAIAEGNNHSCAIHNDQIKCWGYNYHGQLGNTGTHSRVPIDVPFNISGAWIGTYSGTATNGCSPGEGSIDKTFTHIGEDRVALRYTRFVTLFESEASREGNNTFIFTKHIPSPSYQGGSLSSTLTFNFASWDEAQGTEEWTYTRGSGEGRFTCSGTLHVDLHRKLLLPPQVDIELLERQAIVSWDEVAEGAAFYRYELYRPSSPGDVIPAQTRLLVSQGSVDPLTDRQFTLRNVNPGTPYHLQVFGTVASGAAASSATESSFITAPLIKESVNARAKTAVLSWSVTEGMAKKYEFSWTDATGERTTQEVLTRSGNYTLTGLQPYTDYTIRVVARQAGFDDSDPYIVTLKGDVLDVPVLRLRSVAGSLSEVKLSWSSVTVATAYEVSWQERDDPGSLMREEVAAQPGPIQSYTITGLESGSAYTIALSARAAGYADSGPVFAQWPISTAISVGNNHTCAIQNGAAKCWGSNSNGRLGDGTSNARRVAVQVSGLISGVTAISAGSSHTCAIHNGAAKCWGSNSSGRLGDGTRNNSLVAVQVSGLTSGVTSISAGERHTCAVHNGVAKCWGFNGNAQLGDKAQSNRFAPVQVSGLTSGVTSISAGAYHTCAIHNGAVKCWGWNGKGQLGNGTTNPSGAAVQVRGLTSGVTSISAGERHTCAVHDGTVKCWGWNGRGQLGNERRGNSRVPVQVSDLTSGVTMISAGEIHTCAIHNNAAKCWGWNGLGQLGNGTTNPSRVAVQVNGLASSVTAISAGSSHTCAIHDGEFKCWGFNNNGQLGTTGASRHAPAGVSFDIGGEWVGTYRGTANNGCSPAEESIDKTFTHIGEDRVALRYTRLGISFESVASRTGSNTYLFTEEIPSPLYQSGSLSSTLTLNFVSGDEAQGTEEWAYTRGSGEDSSTCFGAFHVDLQRKLLLPPQVNVDAFQRQAIVSWDEVVEGAAFYRYELRFSSSLDVFIPPQPGSLVSQGAVNPMLDKQFILRNLNPGTVYDLRVFSAVASGAVASSVKKPFITMPWIDGGMNIATREIVFSVFNSPVTVSAAGTVVLSWPVTQDMASKYEFRWIDETDARVRVVQEAFAREGSYMLTGIQPDRLYSIRVAARHEGYPDSEALIVVFLTAPTPGFSAPKRFTSRAEAIPANKTQLRLQAFLQGATEEADDGSAYMRTDLAADGILPYSSTTARPWQQIPEGIAAVEVSMLNRDGMDSEVVSRMLAGTPASGSIGIVDWVLVELRLVAEDGEAPVRPTDALRIHRLFALLRSDGSVVNADAENLLEAGALLELKNFKFDDATEDIYIALDHRNHLGVLSSEAAEEDGSGVFTYNFALVREANRSGTTSLKAGDYDGDGAVTLRDIALQSKEQGQSGYLLGDLNLDSNVTRNDRDFLNRSLEQVEGFVKFEPLPQLAAPGNLSGYINATTVSFSWEAVTNAQHYEVTLYRGTGTRVDLLSGPTTMAGTMVVFDDDVLEMAGSYTLTVIAQAAGFKTSVPATTIFRTTQERLPAPTGFTIEAGATTATISWSAADAGKATTYLISYVPEGEAAVAVSDGSYTLTSMTASMLYTLSIVAQAEGFQDSEAYELSFETQQETVDSTQLHPHTSP